MAIAKLGTKHREARAKSAFGSRGNEHQEHSIYQNMTLVECLSTHTKHYHVPQGQHFVFQSIFCTALRIAPQSNFAALDRGQKNSHALWEVVCRKPWCKAKLRASPQAYATSLIRMGPQGVYC